MSYPPREHRQKKQCVQATQLSLMNGAEVNTLAFSVFLMPAAKKQRADPFFFKKKKTHIIYLHYRYLLFGWHLVWIKSERPEGGYQPTTTSWKNVSQLNIDIA